MSEKTGKYLRWAILAGACTVSCFTGWCSRCVFEGTGALRVIGKYPDAWKIREEGLRHAYRGTYADEQSSQGQEGRAGGREGPQ
jgi:hypothetical protein